MGKNWNNGCMNHIRVLNIQINLILSKFWINLPVKLGR